jgi:hypothetical protein
MRLLSRLAPAIFLAAAASPGFAADAVPETVETPETYPYIEGTLDLELADEFVFESDDPGNETNNLNFTGELAVKFGLTPIFSINLGVTAEEIGEPDPFDDRALREHGVYVDTLDIQADIGNFTFLAGKFGPSFGSAWDITPGVFGTDFAEDYELSEQIGFGVAYTFDRGDAGKHVLGANVFFADTTFLSDSAITRRGRTDVDDGGVGNTERLDNFSVTLDGSEIAALPGFSYNLGFLHLSAGVTETADQNGFAFGLAREAEFSNGMTLTGNGEIAYFSDFAGVDGDNALYVTAGFQLARGPWHGELAGTLRKLDFAGIGTDSDHIAQVSAGYEFENGIDISVGYAQVREADIDSSVIGLQLTKSFEFSTRK